MTREQVEALEPKYRPVAELLLEISARLKRLADLLERELDDGPGT